MAIKQDQNRSDSASPNAREQKFQSTSSGGRFFEIHVKGHLNNDWSDWLEGLEMKLLDNGEMILLGSIVDQAGLMGVLIKLNHLNLTLLSVNQVKKKEQPEEE